jgi:hypothetical protein
MLGNVDASANLAVKDLSAARKFSVASRTGSVETPVERTGNSPRTGSPWVVMPLKSSARPVFSAARDISGKRAVRSVCATASQLSERAAMKSRADLLDRRMAFSGGRRAIIARGYSRENAIRHASTH